MNSDVIQAKSSYNFLEVTKYNGASIGEVIEKIGEKIVIATQFHI